MEFAVNSRPLTYIDTEELTPITPLMLVSGLLELTAYSVKRHLYESLLDPEFRDGSSDL